MGSSELLFVFGSSDDRSDVEACGCTHRGGLTPDPPQLLGGFATPQVTSYSGSMRRYGQTRIDPDPGSALHASVDASWEVELGASQYNADFGEVHPAFACMYLLSHLLMGHRALICLLDIAWLGNLASQSALPVAEIRISGHTYCMHMSFLHHTVDTLVP